jgi:HK97 family phage major capsid protein
MANAALVEATERLHAKQAELKTLFDAKPEMDFSDEEVSAIRTKNAELNDLGASYDQLKELDDIARKTAQMGQELTQPARGFPYPGGQPTQMLAVPERPKSLGELLTESAEYKAGVGGPRPSFAVDLPGISLKTTMTESAGWPIYSMIPQRLVLSAQRRPVVADLVPQSMTTYPSVLYMEETTFTNNAAGVLETGTKPESALALTRRTVPLEVIAHLLPVTNQQLEDVTGIRDYIDGRLTFMLQLAEETELLTGNGTSPHLQGFLTKSGIQTQARGADASQDAIYKAMVLVRFTGFAEPSGIVMNPANWQTIRLMTSTTGQYLIAPPTEDGIERLWGKPVVQTPAMTLNSALTGDFQLYSHISRRDGIRIDVSDSHNDNFAKNILSIRAEERLSLEIYRAAAFCTVTGLN